MFLRYKSTISIIVLALVLIAGGVWYAQKPAPETPPAASDNGAQVIEDKNDGLSGGEVDTSSWKTYQNEKYEFELKYHPYWETSASDVGVNEENKHYLLDYLAFNDYKNKNSKDALPLLDIALINTERDDRGPINYGELITRQIINNFDVEIYLNNHYFGYSATAIIKITNTENLVIGVDQVEQREEALNTLDEILNTIKKN